MVYIPISSQLLRIQSVYDDNVSIFSDKMAIGPFTVMRMSGFDGDGIGKREARAVNIIEML